MNVSAFPPSTTRKVACDCCKSNSLFKIKLHGHTPVFLCFQCLDKLFSLMQNKRNEAIHNGGKYS
jgi:hypothetical protein